MDKQMTQSVRAAAIAAEDRRRQYYQAWRLRADPIAFDGYRKIAKEAGERAEMLRAAHANAHA